MAASQTPRTTTESTCTLETARGTHVFRIADYSLQKGLGVGNFIHSRTFAVGGYDWRVRYYPDGAVAQVSKEYISVYLELLTKNAKVRAIYEFSLATPATTGSKKLVYSSVQPCVFNGVLQCAAGTKFKKRSELEASRFLRDDCIVIVCDVTVITETRVEDTTVQVQVPRSNLSDNLRKLLEAKEGADVKIKVEGDVFPAHKIVLAMRSPVFKEDLQKRRGLLARQKRSITIEGMQPAVFEALLHFIYTDSLPSMDHLDGDEHKKMVKHLLVAADRYKMERMKMICADILSKSLRVKTVASIVDLADKHNCSQLTDACVKFIMHSNRKDDVWASQAYKSLKASKPAVAKDLKNRVTRAKQSA